MFNTMTITKAAGALIGSLLFLLLVSWGASALYHVGPTGHVAEGEEHPQAYRIAVDDGGAEGEEEAADEGPDFATLLASADAGAGERVFGKCRACHKLDGGSATGPYLNGVVGRPVASVDGFSYSDAMVAHAAEAPTWEPEALQTFLEDPKGVVPGTKMVFAGLDKPEDRANVIAYLQTVN
ncbi:cytochrome c family protein [uncultured Paracoccus sp.]|uniref:c-type cytochrome n=1 Tax=uncultured Paracoccus sp. TaxID=189685 RepID=UPI0026047DBA|nr:cytochrome c family protein [uncultured Paracoccus sp.]